jgi:hypothetical protein
VARTVASIVNTEETSDSRSPTIGSTVLRSGAHSCQKDFARNVYWKCLLEIICREKNKRRKT